MRILLSLIVMAFISSASATPIWRLDFIHTGGHGAKEGFTEPALVREPGQWSSPWIDHLLRGDYKVELFAKGQPSAWFSQSYNSVYSDWARGVAAKAQTGQFQESVRFPAPTEDATLVISARQLDKPGQPFVPVWQTEILAATSSEPPMAQAFAPVVVRDLLQNGQPQQKLDLLFIAEGFTDGEQDKFFTAAQKAMQALFSAEPYQSYQHAFNVRALFVASNDSGLGGDTALKVNPNALGMARYALTLENQRLRNIAMHAPYDNIVILTNSAKYSASGIFGAYTVVPAFEPRLRFLLVHELGHHLAGLADEYFHDTPGYAQVTQVIEPHEPNVTALQDGKLKWAKWVKADTPIPTPWPRERFMQSMQSDQRWLESQPFANEVGAFVGANYSPTQFYRPALNCLMFRDGGHNTFCPVCSAAILEVINAATSDALSQDKPRPAAHAAAMR
ncbi:IgA Peptidase M64 [Bowmanella denitrificans]|uniref:IgA Peptidase M64 n=1 Tax=Bowmanella denitrificans TaxID=366582 RepID=A0ABP3GH76_9ALTE